MAQFKICRGKEENIPAEITDGYIYMCTDTHNIFMDWFEPYNELLMRWKMNAEYADKLRYIGSDNEYIEVDPGMILDHIKDTNNPHNVKKEQLGVYIASTDEVVEYIGI